MPNIFKGGVRNIAGFNAKILKDKEKKKRLNSWMRK